MIKITDARYGVKFEIDGFEVPELVSLRLTSEVDSLVQIGADVYATKPFEVLLNNDSVCIEFTNFALAESARRLVKLIEDSYGAQPIRESQEFDEMRQVLSR